MNIMAGHVMKVMICVGLVLHLVHGQPGVVNKLVNMTMVNNALSKGAVCLDGSPSGYFYDPGFGAGANNWMVHLMGGGWCHNETDCIARSLGGMGSTNKMSQTISFSGMLSSSQEINPYFYDWNKILIAYCDGASFSADVEYVDPKNNLHRRGARIFKAVMEELLEKGMNDANNAILAGSSAGGLSTTLKCDEFRALLHNVPRVKCVSDAGVFFRGKGLPGAKTLREQYYASIVRFHELAPVLPKSCTSKMDPHLCLFAENFIGDIKTPVFVIQSAFDGWQLDQIVKHQPLNWVNCTKTQLPCNQHQVRVLRQFRRQTLKAFKNMGPSASRGLFITSCFYHTYNYMKDRWNGRHMLKNKTPAHAIGDWYYDMSPFQEVENINVPINCDLQ